MNTYQLGGLLRAFVIFSLLATLLLSAVASMRGGVVAALVCAASWLAYLFCATPVLVRRPYDLFEPMTLVVLATLIGVALRAPFVFLTEDQEALDYLLLGKAPDVLLGGAAVLLVGMPFLAAGYLQPAAPGIVARRGLMHANVWSQRRLRLLALVILAISALSLWAFIGDIRQNLAVQTLGDLSSKRFGAVEGAEFRTAFGYSRWGVSLIGLLFLLYVVDTVAAHERVSVGRKALLVVLGALSLAFPVFVSSRMEMVAQIIMVAPAYVYLRGILPVRFLVAAALVVFALYMAVTGLRSRVQSAEELGDFYTRLPLVEETVASRQYIDVVKTSLEVETYPSSEPFRLGTSYLSALSAVVPRTVWPDKPPVGLGKVVGRDVYGLHGAGVPAGFIGELWINFGWVMIIPGMYLLGRGLRVYYEAFRSFQRARNGAVLYSALFVPVTFRIVTNDFTVGIVDCATTLLPALLAIWFVSVPFSRSADAVTEPRAVPPAPIAGVTPASR